MCTGASYVKMQVHVQHVIVVLIHTMYVIILQQKQCSLTPMRKKTLTRKQIDTYFAEYAVSDSGDGGMPGERGCVL